MKICSMCESEVKKITISDPPTCKNCYRKYINKEIDKRDTKIQVKCNYGVSKKCCGTQYISIRAYNENCKRNHGTYICIQCSRNIKHSGRNNPNCKYNTNDDFFNIIDSEEKAYILGFIASDGSIRESGTISIAIHEKDRFILNRIRDIVSSNSPILDFHKNLKMLCFCSSKMASDVCKHLSISPGKKDRCVGFPDFKDEKLGWAFIRGVFDGDGFVSSVYFKRTAPRCGIASYSKMMRDGICSFCKIPAYVSDTAIEWDGNNALDFLGKIYEGATIYMARKRDLYIDWSQWVPSLSGKGTHGIEATFKWNKTDIRAVAPSKSKVSDSGYDLTLIEKIKSIGNVDFYTTGIRVQPSFGYYFDLVGRSSISKCGYMLSNGFGVIDRSYTGPIIAPLIKTDPDAKELELPAKIVQIIPRQIIHMQLIEVESLDDTARGSGGFGHTGR